MKQVNDVSCISMGGEIGLLQWPPKAYDGSEDAYTALSLCMGSVAAQVVCQWR